jgi:hypothetical protein
MVAIARSTQRANALDEGEQMPVAALKTINPELTTNLIRIE